MQHSSGARAKARDNNKARRFAISLCYLTVLSHCAISLSVLSAQASYHLSISLPTQPQVILYA